MKLQLLKRSTSGGSSTLLGVFVCLPETLYKRLTAEMKLFIPICLFIAVIDVVLS